MFDFTFQTDDHNPIREVWHILDKDKKMGLSRQDIALLDSDRLEKVSEAINYAYAKHQTHDEL